MYRMDPNMTIHKNRWNLTTALTIKAKWKKYVKFCDNKLCYQKHKCVV